ncbi:MAG: hypothetical protein PHH35_00980 [Candidatus Pacebacteria bacterium]|nr:hypothetical protein [Candidatus Paceibacterota bacterium]
MKKTILILILFVLILGLGVLIYGYMFQMRESDLPVYPEIEQIEENLPLISPDKLPQSPPGGMVLPEDNS